MPSTASLQLYDEPRLKNAIAHVPRGEFVRSAASQAFISNGMPSEDIVLQILKPLVRDGVLNSGTRVLHVGTGSGYFDAVLARLASQVFSLEKQPSLVEQAVARFDAPRYANITVRLGDGEQGWPEAAPFDCIVVSSPSLTRFDHLLKQLRPGGVLLFPHTMADGLFCLKKITANDKGGFTTEKAGVISYRPTKTDIVIDLGEISPDLVHQARLEAQQQGAPVVEVLRSHVNADDERLYRALAEEYDLPLGDVDQLLKQVTPGPFRAISKAFLDYHQLLPLNLQGKSLTVATSDPTTSVDELQVMYPECQIEKVLVTPTDLRRLWSAMDLLQQQPVLQTKSTYKAHETEDLLTRSHTRLEAHFVSLFEAILLDAVVERASDIHIEIYSHQVRVRLRVDGELRDLKHYHFNATELRGVINVIKTRADLNIAERRLPQGGRSRLKVGNAVYDLRVQIQPSLHGEHAIIRLLPQSNALIGIEELGLSPLVAKSYQRMIYNPAGLLLVVGPTGSGKSTTLYAGLQVLGQDAARKVITIEDPVEYSIDSIQQTQVKSEIGFHFADAMRAFVRQDPDVIMVGEIRDQETALEAIRASQTGHVVLSTLHANDAVDALQRIYDLGIHPNSLAGELLGVMAQRLAKRICDHCRAPAEPDAAILAELFPEGVPTSFRCFEGRGCVQCNGKGTAGRVAVVEYLEVNPDIRNAISLQPPVTRLRQLAMDAGLVTMRDSAIEHVVNGLIPLSELPRVLPKERMAPEARGLLEKPL